MLAIALSGGLIFSGWVAWREWRSERIEAEAHRLVAGVAVGSAEARLDRLIRSCGSGCPARGLEAAAAAKAAMAEKAGPEARGKHYQEAEALTRRALARNPLSAEGWARLAMILFAQHGDGVSNQVLEALRTSYSAAPFSRGAAVWRIGFCAGAWSAIGPDLRKNAVNELVWLASIDHSLAEEVVAGVDDETAKFALTLALSMQVQRPE